MSHEPQAGAVFERDGGDWAATDRRYLKYAEPHLVRAADQTPSTSIRLPLDDRVGFNRVWHRGIAANNAWARLMTFPPGQQAPVHAVTVDHIIFMVRGKIEFHLRDTTYTLDEGDLFYFPANWIYTITNSSPNEASFLSLAVVGGYGWPPVPQYFVGPEDTASTAG